MFSFLITMNVARDPRAVITELVMHSWNWVNILFSLVMNVHTSSLA